MIDWKAHAFLADNANSTKRHTFSIESIHELELDVDNDSQGTDIQDGNTSRFDDRFSPKSTFSSKFNSPQTPTAP